VDGPFQLCGVTLTAAAAAAWPHDGKRVPSWEVEGRKLAAYLSDCKTVPPEVIEKIKGVEALIIEPLRHSEASHALERGPGTRSGGDCPARADVVHPYLP